MKDPAIEALLALQTHDMRRRALETRLAQMPADAKRLDAATAAENADYEAKRAAVVALERSRADLRAQRRALEEKIARFKAQQSQVRKNEEFAALAKQIEEGTARVGDFEGEELEILFKIDAANAALETERTAHADRLAALDVRKKNLAAEEAAARAELATEAAAFEAAKGAVAPDYLAAYLQVGRTGKRPPFVAPVADGICRGCHMRTTSAGALAAPKGPVLCDNCGRVIYSEN